METKHKMGNRNPHRDTRNTNRGRIGYPLPVKWHAVWGAQQSIHSETPRETGMEECCDMQKTMAPYPSGMQGNLRNVSEHNPWASPKRALSVA